MHTTVVIPAKNASTFLFDALRSIAAQTVQAAEVIVVDDHSDDNTAKIAESAAHELAINLRVLASQGHGPSAARNTAVAEARTPALMFVDADDLLPTTALEDQIGALRAGAVTFGFERRFATHTGPAWFDGDVRSTDRFSVTPGSLAAHRDVFGRTGPFPETGGAAETVLWFDTLLEHQVRIDRVERVVRLRRVHGANFSSTQEQTSTSYAAGLKAVLDARRARGARE
jgi:glycosyltransferase involved in cell wall biosynthesis